MKLVIVGFGRLCCGCLLSQATSEEEIGGPEQMTPAACLQMIKNTPRGRGGGGAQLMVQHCPHVRESRGSTAAHPKQCWVCQSTVTCIFQTYCRESFNFMSKGLRGFQPGSSSSLNPHVSNLWHFPSLFTARKTVPVIFLSVSKIKAVEIPAVCEGKSRRGQTTLTGYYTRSANIFSTLRVTCGGKDEVDVFFGWQRRAEKWLWRLLMLFRSSWPFRWHVCWLLWKGQP